MFHQLASSSYKVFPIPFSLCHKLASDYFRHVRGSSVTCPTQPTGRIRPSPSDGASLTDRVLRRGEALHLGLGLSCCSSPSEPDLGVVWGRHRPALVNLLLTLQVCFTGHQIGWSETCFKCQVSRFWQ